MGYHIWTIENILSTKHARKDLTNVSISYKHKTIILTKYEKYPTLPLKLCVRLWYPYKPFIIREKNSPEQVTILCGKKVAGNPFCGLHSL